MQPKAESALQTTYKEALKLKKRLAVIKAVEVNTRMADFTSKCEALYSFCNNGATQFAAFAYIFSAEFKSRLQFALAGLPNYVLMETNPERKRGSRAKRPRFNDFKGMC